MYSWQSSVHLACSTHALALQTKSIFVNLFPIALLAPVRFHHVPTVQFLIAPFSHIYYMQAMKNWTVGRPGKEGSAYTNY